MEKKKTGKIIAIIVAAVIIIAGASVGVMAACGVFSSGKAKAFELLSQATEKMSQSSVNEYVGWQEMLESINKKGGMTEFKISNLTMDSSIAPTGLDLSEFSLESSARTDVENDKLSMNGSIAKGDSKISWNLYNDKEKIVVALPELIQGKTFKIDTETIKSMAGSAYNFATASPEMEEFTEGFEKFLEEEIGKVKDEITCEKLDGEKSGYTLVIKKETMNTVMNDLVEFLTEQKAFVDKVNTYVNTFMYRLKSTTTKTFDLISEMKALTASLSQYTQDFAFNVYGDNGNLVGLEAAVTVENIPVKATVDFAGEKGNSTITLKVTAEQNGQEAGLTAIYKDTKADTYGTSFTMDAAVGSFSVATVEIAETINPSDNSYSLDASVKAEGSEVAKFVCQGSIKDLKPGSYADFVWDNISVRAGGVDLFSMALDMKFGVLDGSIEPPKGEEVNLKSITDLAPYMTEVQTALVKIFSDWGINPSQLANNNTSLGDNDTSLGDNDTSLGNSDTSTNIFS